MRPCVRPTFLKLSSFHLPLPFSFPFRFPLPLFLSHPFLFFPFPFLLPFPLSLFLPLPLSLTLSPFFLSLRLSIFLPLPFTSHSFSPSPFPLFCPSTFLFLSLPFPFLNLSFSLLPSFFLCPRLCVQYLRRHISVTVPDRRWSLWTTHRKSIPGSRMVTWPVTSRNPKKSNSWPHYLWGAISP